MSDDAAEQIDFQALGITPEDVEDAGGQEAVAHIVWFFQQNDNHDADQVDKAIQEAIKKKKQEKELADALSDDNEEAEEVSEDIDSKDLRNAPSHKPISLSKNSTLHHIQEEDFDSNIPISQLYEKFWGDKPHSALKLLVRAFFFEIQDTIPTAEEVKEIKNSIALLRAYIAKLDLPLDAEEERLIVFGRDMYKEFYQNKEDYNNCPITYLVDENIDKCSQKHIDIARELPPEAIVKLYSDCCFYDDMTHQIDEPLPEEVDIENLCRMIETLARQAKIWQEANAEN